MIVTIVSLMIRPNDSMPTHNCISPYNGSNLARNTLKIIIDAEGILQIEAHLIGV